jgi:hypothetical protein
MRRKRSPQVPMATAREPCNATSNIVEHSDRMWTEVERPASSADLVTEVTLAGKDQCHVVFVGGRDHLGVAHTSPRLDCRGHADSG